VTHDKKLWVFFDEFNTTDNLGLICEILTNRTFLGDTIPDNMVLLAACNPYKLRAKRNKFDENVGIKRANA
jgi:E3 ubiquitin-protein ligase RNF213